MSVKKKIAVVFGGRSIEHEISVLSALQVIDALDVKNYDIVPVYIAQSGKWYSGAKLKSKDFYRGLPQTFNQVDEVHFSPAPGVGGLIKKSRTLLGSVKEDVIPVDVYIPVFHGQYGEDGCIQGLFELADVAYAGSSVLASAVAMNKYICKKLLGAHGIPVLPGITIKKQEALVDITGACKIVMQTEGFQKFPLFIKPVNLGSSVGVSKANSEAELAAGLAKVFQFDLEAIIEPCITNLMEINVSVLERDASGNVSQNDVSVVEIPVASGEFLSYEDKYMREGKGKKGPSSNSLGMAGLTRVIDPNNLESRFRDGVQKYAGESYEILQCSGVVRFDFMVDLDSGELYFNELNPIPGSLSFYLWDRSNPALLLSDVLDRIISGSLARYSEKKQLKRDFGFKALAPHA